jgi:hypothetical protein
MTDASVRRDQETRTPPHEGLLSSRRQKRMSLIAQPLGVGQWRASTRLWKWIYWR